jgi:hypothetical protein
VLNLSQTWNNGTTTFTGALLNVTDTNSTGTSLLMDLGTGGGTFVSKFSVSKFGTVTASEGATANTFSLRNGVNAQIFNMYYGYTDASNYAKIMISGNSGDVVIEPVAAGTYPVQNLNLRCQGNNVNIDYPTLRFRATLAGFAVRWTLNTAGNFLAGADNAYDIGGAGARPRYVYAASAIVTAPRTLAAGASQIASAATAGAGARSFVTDATMSMALGVGTVATAGGANSVPVYSDGTNWLIG